jgi:putative colanic acid biosynthesis glycosyltransferase
MKILQIGATYKKTAQGSIEKAIHDKLLSSENESKVFFLSGKECVEKNAVIFENNIENFIRKILTKLLIKNQVIATLSTLKLIKMIKRYSPDIIHLHTIHHNTVNYKQLFRFLIKYKKPVVYTIHDMWPFTGGCYHFYSIKCKKFLRDCSKCAKNKSELDCCRFFTKNHRLFKERAYNRMENIVFVSVSDWVRKQVNSSFLSEFYNVSIYNGVNIGEFKLSPKHNKIIEMFPNKKIILGVANYWTKKKGLDKFLELSHMINDSYVIILVGNYDEASLIEKRRLFMFGECRSKEELASLYSTADVFVNMSEEETFGMVIAEAACCGLKVIGFNSTGIVETIHRAKGILIENNDLYEVWHQIRIICDNGIRLDGNELIYVRKEFSMEIMIEKYISLYNFIIEGSIL